MPIIKKISILIPIALISILITADTYSQRTKSSQRAGEQRKAEKGLKDNRYFFYFINTSISNFGTEAEKKIFKEAIQRDMLAQLLYMRFMFFESFVEIRKSQELLIDLYRKILRKDILATKELLGQFVTTVIKCKDNSAMEYLRLGYRDMKVAETFFLMADNFKTSLYSLRLYKYVHAIKNAKHGKRYSFLSVLLARDIIDFMKEISKYDTFEKEQKILKIKSSIRNLGYKDLEKRLAEIPPPEKKDYYELVHYDNFYKTRQGKSFYDIIWEKPALHELKEYKEYLGSD